MTEIDLASDDDCLGGEGSIAFFVTGNVLVLSAAAVHRIQAEHISSKQCTKSPVQMISFEIGTNCSHVEHDGCCL